MKKPQDCVSKVRAIITGKWFAPWQIQDELAMRYGIMISESNVCARIRDNRKDRFGGWDVQKQAIRREDGTGYYFEYKIKCGSSRQIPETRKVDA